MPGIMNRPGETDRFKIPANDIRRGLVEVDGVQRALPAAVIENQPRAAIRKPRRSGLKTVDNVGMKFTESLVAIEILNDRWCSWVRASRRREKRNILGYLRSRPGPPSERPPYRAPGQLAAEHMTGPVSVAAVAADGCRVQFFAGLHLGRVSNSPSVCRSRR